MKKALLITYLFISTLSYCQKLYQYPYEKKMDSINLYKLNFRIHNNRNIGIKEAYLLNGIKLTCGTMVNTNDFRHFNQMGLVSSDYFNDASPMSYFSIFKYDIRIKYYITKRFRIITRMVLMGANYKQNQYLCGLFIKF